MSKIEKLIAKETTAKSLSAGKQISSDRLIDFDYAKIGEFYHAYSVVIGSRGNRYNVMVKFSESKLEEAQCSCPYDWGGVCKHIVAVSMELDNSLAEEKEKKLAGMITTAGNISTKLRKTSDPFDFAYQTQTLQSLVNINSYHKVSRELWLYEFQYAFEEEALKIFLDFNTHSSRKMEVVVQIKASKKKGHIAITSDPVSEVKSLSNYELAALLLLKQYNLGSILKAFDVELKQEMLLEYAAMFGISDFDKAQKYFELKNNENGLYVGYKSGAPRLMQTDKKIAEPQLADMQGMSELQLLKNQNIIKNKKQLFFYIENSISGNSNRVLSINPFFARIKKNGDLYSGAIERVFDQHNYNNVDVDEFTLGLINKCYGTIPQNFSRKYAYKISTIEDENQQTLFALGENYKQINEIWTLLQDKDIEVYLSPAHLNKYMYELDSREFLGKYQLRRAPSLFFELSFQEDTFQLSPMFHHNDVDRSVFNNGVQWIHTLVYSYQETLFLVDAVKDAYYIFYFLSGQPGIASMAENFHQFFEDIVQPISKEYDIKITNLPDSMTYEVLKPEKIEKSVYLKELDKFILIRPLMRYGESEVNVLDGAGQLFLSGNTITSIERDKTQEDELKDFVIHAHPLFSKGTNQEFISISIDDFVKDYWFLEFVKKANEQGIAIYGFNEFKNFKYSSTPTKVNLNTSSGIDWFDVEVAVTVGDHSISLREVKKAILAKRKYIKLGDGKLAVLPEEWIKKLEKYLRIGKVEKDRVKISKYGFNVLEEVFDEAGQEEIRKEIREKKDKLKKFKEIKDVKLPDINATLRDYQKEGYQWLHFLNEYGWGGILADDMGLGKTLQVITLLKSMVDKGKKTHLIVVPTSLLFNWKKEIEKFCPSLKYVIHHGTGRDKDIKSWKKTDLIITTYGMVVADFDVLKKVKFNYLVLDESQAIKNPLSKRFKAVTALKATHRLAMTGTPVENNTFDLYAQVSFVNPGFFVSTEHFKNTYSLPIDRDGDQQVAEELTKMINPFLLRRTKELVAKELPPKTEDVIYCDMESSQRKVYDAYRNKIRNDLQGMIEQQGMEKSKLHILQAMTKIRQICNSPALLDDDENYGDDSIKIKELMRHIREKTGQHKILIFSQFVSMLSLIRKELDKNDLAYAYLDGQTSQKNREGAVKLFQEDQSVRLFLISLKAGGTGLNLTAADYVYLVDPWWNPAVENQAIDRCYRIGQDKKVIAYRMICKDTIEEKIMNYKARKQSVADAIIKTDENMMKQLTKDDMMELFD